MIDLKLHDLSNVVAFAKVVKAKSFTAAARQLGMSKATISKQVSTLEGRIGVRLLNRTTRTLNLTSAGISFFRTADTSLPNSTPPKSKLCVWAVSLMATYG